MAILDDEILHDAAEDAQAINYVRTQLPDALKERYTEDVLQQVIDITVDVLASSDILDAEADADGYVNIDMDTIASEVAKQAAADGLGQFEVDDLLVVIEAWMDFDEKQNG